MTTRFSDEIDDLAAHVHSAMETLDVAKIQSPLASGVRPDLWNITDDCEFAHFWPLLAGRAAMH